MTTSFTNVQSPGNVCALCGYANYPGMVHQCATAPLKNPAPVVFDTNLNPKIEINHEILRRFNIEQFTKWDIRFLKMARLVGSWSKDPSTQTGAVIVRPDRSVASVGFNGFPRNMKDDPALYADREQKYSRIVHAEINALIHATGAVNGHTLYIYPLAPCDRCAVQLLQAGITRFVFPTTPEDQRGRWEPILRKASSYIREAGATQVEVPLHHLQDMTPARETRTDYV